MYTFLSSARTHKFGRQQMAYKDYDDEYDCSEGASGYSADFYSFATSDDDDDEYESSEDEECSDEDESEKE